MLSDFMVALRVHADRFGVNCVLTLSGFEVGLCVYVVRFDD